MPRKSSVDWMRTSARGAAASAKLTGEAATRQVPSASFLSNALHPPPACECDSKVRLLAVFIQGGEEIFLVASCYRTGDKLRPHEPLPVFLFFPAFLFFKSRLFPAFMVLTANRHTNKPIIFLCMRSQNLMTELRFSCNRNKEHCVTSRWNVYRGS